MELAQEKPPNNWLTKITNWVLLIAGLYSVYQVLHPYTIFSSREILIFDIVQIERAAHVFLLLFAGYLVASQQKGVRTLGSWFFVAFTLVPLYAFWQIKQPGLEIKLLVTVVWAFAILPALLPQYRRYADIVAALFAIAPFVYQLLFYEQLVYRAVIPEVWDIAMSFSLIMLVLGMVYRFIGPIMPMLVLVFLIYNLYGRFLPQGSAFFTPGVAFDQMLGKMYNETEAGIYGLITGVSAKYLVYFTILSGMIGALGLGKIVANVALAMVGRSPQTPGRVTGLASVFMGMFSGSGAADTQFVATITKPLYEKANYDRMIGAGLVATAGTIALITPPVLGSIAFLMVEILQISYLSVVIMALGPCILYLLSVFAYNEFYTRKVKLPAVGADEKALARGYALRYSTIFLPIVVIIVMLFRGLEVSTSVYVAMLTFIAITYFDPTLRPKAIQDVISSPHYRWSLWLGLAGVLGSLAYGFALMNGGKSLESVIIPVTSLVFAAFFGLAFLLPGLLTGKAQAGIAPLLEGLREGFRYLLPIGTAITAANLIFAMLVISGLPGKFTLFLSQVSGESLFLATLVTAIFSLILGMGVPPTATYVLTASLTAPAIIKLASVNFQTYGLEPEQAVLAATLATHMFLFYYAVLADVTPPVALSAYAAASVFNTNPILTGVYAARVALAKYFLGFFFLLAYTGTGVLILPILQTTPGLEGWLIILERIFFTAAAIIFLSAATVGYTRRPLARWESWVMGLLSLSLFYPYPNLWMGFIPLVLCTLFFLRGESKPKVTGQAAD
ncbi:MAG: TRAP transporter fused permease subunit [Meiothermus sp.]|nr:TRAP transporter fused permease subunit [Meiothermus sp.]